MVSTIVLLNYLTTLLQPDDFADYCPNGLQIQGKADIEVLVTGVTANQALIDASIAKGADALLVHHGLFWKGEALPLTGIKYQRIRPLVVNEVNLLAYHLPLDAHPIYGNNTQLGHLLEIQHQDVFAVEPGLDLGSIGQLTQPMDGQDFADLITEKLVRAPLSILAENRPIKRVAWCTGAAQDFIDKAVEQGADAYVTGEVSERTVHLARENNIHFFAAGHHATERYGVIALGEHLAQHFGIEHTFIDIDNPV